MATPLYVRSSFSILESVIKTDDLIRKIKDLGFFSVGIVDHNMNGCMAIYRKLTKENIKAVFGLEVMVKTDEIHDIVLFARNDNGLKNLMKLSTYINTVSETLDFSLLKGYLNDVIVVISSDSRFFYNFSDDTIGKLKHLFGEFYIGISSVYYEDMRNLNSRIREAAQKEGIKTFMMNKAFYLESEDYEAYKVLRAIKDKKTIDDKDLTDDRGHHILDAQEMARYFTQDEIVMSDYIASMCNVKMEFDKTSLPVYECPNGVSPKDYLINLSRAGLYKRLKGQDRPEYKSRLNYELKVIISMHFENYFLIVYDFIRYAKRNGIYVGPGRGSAAGSLVSYCLGITEIDPIRYGLIFERFLNPQRISMPDIDVDFPDNRRDEVIEYVKNKYGDKHVAHIVTYGTMQARQVLRDVARVLKYDNIGLLVKALPNDPKITLINAYNTSRIFKERVSYNDKTRELFELSLKLEGLPRHYSTHAAGIVMSRIELDDVLPLLKIENDLYSTGYTMEYLEDIGLIKMDFLALKNLSIISEITDDIKKDQDFNLALIPLNDKKTFDMLCDVRTLGIFQLESGGIQSLIRKMQPKTFEDIALTIALYRPGPMENIPSFLHNRMHPEDITYLHPKLVPILKETSGIIVYQEQIMSIARELSSFSYGKADILRKAMSKKKMDELKGLEEDFIKGAIKNNISEEVAHKIYDMILKFANYGFNKSHSIAYARVAYELSYLKANYPQYFYKALLNGVIGAQSKTFEYISECLKISQKIIGPDINRSYECYIIEDGAIRMPLSIIKNVGSVSLKGILEERNLHGIYRDFEDAVVRIRKYAGRNVIESLISGGAFDCFGLSRKTMLVNLNDALKKDETFLDLNNPMFKMKIINVKEDVKELVNKEKEVLGFNFSVNPIFELKKQYQIDTKVLSELIYERGYIKAFGYVLSFREYITKNHDRMCFLKVSDDTETMDLVVHASIYARYEEILRDSKGKYIYFEGNVEKDGSCIVKVLRMKR